ncbi:hypothetical protein, partial [Klebsiella pneumoniae]|uniref:hypothetical protein n=1 Tax=Klebsiella pneumoniae TaxID=573 RepID=UPI0022B64E3C
DAGTTRKLIQLKYRKRGTIITYYNGISLVTERYNYSTLTDAYWENSIYWEKITTTTDVDLISSYLGGVYYTQVGYAVMRSSGAVD